MNYSGIWFFIFCQHMYSIKTYPNFYSLVNIYIEDDITDKTFNELDNMSNTTGVL